MGGRAIKLAPIVPPHMEHLIPPETQRVFCFADIAVSDQEYLQSFKNREGVIVDNQIYENVQVPPPATYGAVMKELGGHLVILPDSRSGFLETMRMAEQYLPYCPIDRTAGVIQGSSMAELEECANRFVQDFGLSWLAIPTRVPNRPVTRRQLFENLEMGDWPVRFHFLGADFPYHDEAILRQHYNIDSVDTAEPYNAAFNMMDLRDGPHKRDAYFMKHGAEDTPLRLAPGGQLWSNIRELSDLAATRPESMVLERLRKLDLTTTIL